MFSSPHSNNDTKSTICVIAISVVFILSWILDYHIKKA